MRIERCLRLFTRFGRHGKMTRCCRCKYATKSKLEFTSKLKPGKNTWVLTSQNIFENLALEDWLYKHENFHEDTSLLLLWRNTPCVVIGRHQNPWAELDVAKATRDGIRVARRNSGGGTVYHDLGNMCVTFMTSRERYNRTQNLELVCAALTRNFSLNVSMNCRDDLLLNEQFKISGTAAKLGGKVAYHHLTLLLDADKSTVSSVLKPTMKGLESNATESVPAQIMNLREADPSVTFERVCQAVASQYCDTQLYSGISDQEVVHVESLDRDAFPEIHRCCEEFSSWEWVYGKTPKFTINRLFRGLVSHIQMTLDLHLEVDKGRLKEVQLQLSGSECASATAAVFCDALRETRFSREDIDDVTKRIRNDKELFNKCDDVGYTWIAQCLYEVF